MSMSHIVSTRLDTKQRDELRRISEEVGQPIGNILRELVELALSARHEYVQTAGLNICQNCLQRSYHAAHLTGHEMFLLRKFEQEAGIAKTTR